MAKLIIFITARIDESSRIGEAWLAAGVPGVTILEAHGIRRLQKAAKGAEILPGMMSLLDIMRQNNETSIIMLSAVENDAVVDAVIQQTEAILGNLREPNNGILLVVDLERVIGIRDHSKS